MEQSANRTQAILSWQRTAQVDLRIEQDESRRYLVLNGQRQSQMLLQQPSQPCYPHLLLLFDWLIDKPWQHFLQLGLGGGECSRALAARYPERQVTSIEQQPLIIEAYQQFFQPVPHPNEQLIASDAMTFAQHAAATSQYFDVIFVDMYPWPTDWPLLMQKLLVLRSKKCWLCINLPGDLTEDLTGQPQALWEAFWQQQQVQLQCLKVPCYRNQLWLGF